MFSFNKKDYQKFYTSKFQKKTISKIEKHLLLVCAPKSGSTWVSHILEDLLKWNSIRLAPSFEHREQEIDLSPLLAQGVKGKIISPHQHLRYSLYTEELIRKMDSFVVLQIRNIYDTIISYRDHMDQESVRVPAAFMEQSIWDELSDLEKTSFIVDMVVPWYFNFYCGWVTSPLYSQGKVLLLTYEDMKSDTVQTVKSIMEFVNEDVRLEDVNKSLENISKKKTRKNKGVVGRGEVLSEFHKEKILSYCSYYPGINFLPLGIDSNA